MTITVGVYSVAKFEALGALGSRGRVGKFSWWPNLNFTLYLIYIPLKTVGMKWLQSDLFRQGCCVAVLCVGTCR